MVRKVKTTFRELTCLGLLAFAAAGGTARAQDPRIEEALGCLEAIEQQIRDLHARQAEEQARLLEAGRVLDANRTSLSGREQLSDRTREFLSEMGTTGEQRMQALVEQLERERATANDVQRRGREAGALLAWQAMRLRVEPALMAGTALAAVAHRDRERIASARALRAAAEHGELGRRAAEVASATRQYSTFEEASLRQLREQQQRIVDEIAAIQSSLEAQGDQIRQLANQREELSALIASLNAERAAEPTPVPTPTQTAMAPIESAPRPAFPPGVATGAGTPSARPDTELAEVPDETDAVPVADAGTEAGPRQLFWHASPVAVHSLAPGRVAFSGSVAGYRHLLIVDIGGGWHALYGNMTECTMQIGDEVAVGDRLGVYQAAESDRALPFWFEVRRGVEPVPLEQWTELPDQWQRRLFGEVGAR